MKKELHPLGDDAFR